MSQNTFKKYGIIILLVFFVVPLGAAGDEIQLVPSQESQKGAIKVGLRFTGGGFLLMRSDFIEHIQGMYDIYEAAPYVHSLESEGFGSTNLGLNFAGELFVDFTENIGIGIGSGYITHNEERSLVRDIGCGTFYTHNYNPKFSAVPLTVSLYLGLPVSQRIKIVFNTGVGYYLGKADWVYEEYSNGGVRSEIDWSASSNALGLHGGLDFEFLLTSRFAFVVGARGRYAKIKSLTGDYNHETHHPVYGHSKGTLNDLTLWYGIWEDLSTGEDYPKVVFAPSEPYGTVWSDVREGEINLSGLVFQAGLKVTF